MFIFAIIIILINAGLTEGQTCDLLCTIKATTALKDQTVPSKICSIYTEFENCVYNLTCMSSTEKAVSTETLKQFIVTRYRTTCESSIKACATPTLDQCFLQFQTSYTKNENDAALLCSAYESLSQCVNSSNCGDSTDRKQSTLSSAKTIIQFANCEGTTTVSTTATTTTTIKTTTTTRETTTAKLVACATPTLDQCFQQFQTLYTENTNDAALVCNAYESLSQCVNSSNCGDSTDRKQSTLSSAKTIIQFANCEGTTTVSTTATTTTTIKTTTTTRETTTAKLAAATTSAPSTNTPSSCIKDSFDQCLTTYAASFSAHGFDEVVSCRDLNDLTSCFSKVGCGTDPKTSFIVSQSKQQLQNGGIICSTPTTTFLPQTTPRTTTSTVKEYTAVTTAAPVTKECKDGLDSCYLTFFMTSVTRSNERDLLCGDLRTLSECVSAINCPASERQKKISEGESRLSARSINCSVPSTCNKDLLNQCMTTFVISRTTNGLDTSIACGYFNDLTICLSKTLCSTVDTSPYINQAKKQLEAGLIDCSVATTTVTTRPTITVPASTAAITTVAITKACKDGLDSCYLNFFMTTVTRTNERDLLCGDLHTLSECVSAINCPVSERQKKIKEGESRLSARSINCSAPSTCNKDLLNQCMTTFVISRTTNGLDKTIACRDFNDLNVCLSKTLCTTVDTSPYINQAKKQLEAGLIDCSVTSTTTVTSTSTTPASTTSTTAVPVTKECKDGLDSCYLTFFMTSTTRANERDLLCGDLRTLSECVSAINCPVSEKQKKISEGENRLLTRNINCSAPSSCNKDLLSQCMIIFVTSRTTNGMATSIACRDFDDLTNCLAKTSCSTVDTSPYVNQAKKQLEAGLIDCTTTVNCVPNLDLISQCLQSYEKNVQKHGDETKYICTDLSVFLRCINNISCLGADYKYTLTSFIIEQKVTEDVKCSLSTFAPPISTTAKEIKSTTLLPKSDVITTVAVTQSSLVECQTGQVRCANTYNAVMSSTGLTKERACSEIKKFYSCVFAIQACNFSEADKKRYLTTGQAELDKKSFPCNIISMTSSYNDEDGVNSGSKQRETLRSAFMSLSLLILLFVRY
ncbi:mucin-5AC-like isoform X3 [Biomphalaria glabrata]|uniref:Mucin-5AC-like isoform X3 n=1 Tax=Biomphalaria glabrata TaxID=6526 RepID=A0A9W3A7E5_BIOGL|nr:mucin-5AC-like isoform X3 [Biomphalaria glabrata]